MISEELRAKLIRTINDAVKRRNMTIIPSDKWTKAATPDFPLWASLYCPGCGLEVGVSKKNHTIASDGTVSPSMVCPHAPCQFHEYIKLDEWNGQVSTDHTLNAAI